MNSGESTGSDRLRPLLEVFFERYGVPAAGAAVVAHTGDLDVEVAGQRHRNTVDTVDVNDQWHIGSCAKSMTAALYARLVERGDAAWGVPVPEFFRDLAGSVNAGWSHSTIDEVLVCRSGMDANLNRAQMVAAWGDTADATDQRTRAVVSALSDPPRTRGSFRYSNLGYIVVGAAIDRLAGMPFEDALHAEVLEPLGITTAGLGPPPDIWGHKSRLQIGGITAGRGSPAEPGLPRSDNPAVMTPAGRLHLTLADWAKFQRVFLNRGSDFLESATVEHLLAIPAGKGNGMAMGWAPAAGLAGVSYGMQGSNTLWAATALIDSNFERTAMVVANSGRSRVLKGSAQLAVSILQSGSTR